jgi:uncharacterized protein involved in exopolysaccharide biosynthesis
MIPGILAVVWGAGIAAAYREYTTTFESAATIWVLRPSPELTNLNPEDPGTPVIQTVASQQTELIAQLLKSDSFIRDLVQRTSSHAALDAAADEARYLDEIRKRFDVETLGTNMLRVSFTSNDPKAPVEMVNAALAVRTERVLNARVTSTAAVGTLYRREFEVAQAQALDANRELDAFRSSHTGELSAADAAHQAQLQLAVDFAQSRLSELRGRADRAAVAAAVLEMSGLEFQVVDEPREQSAPSGGGRPAAMIAMVAIASGALLVALLVLVGAFLADHLEGPLDIGRLAPARLFATVPRVAVSPGQEPGDVRASLATIAFEQRGAKV